jgi:hypothetical protein
VFVDIVHDSLNLVGVHGPTFFGVTCSSSHCLLLETDVLVARQLLARGLKFHELSVQ